MSLYCARWSTTLEPSKVAPDRLVHGYRWEDERWKDETLLANGSFGSMGGMLTSVSDLTRYVGMFLAVLQLMRHQHARAVQSELFNQIWLEPGEAPLPDEIVVVDEHEHGKSGE